MICFSISSFRDLGTKQKVFRRKRKQLQTNINPMYGKKKNKKKVSRMNPRIGKPVTIILPEKMTEEIARIAKKRGMKNAEVFRMMVDLGISVHKDMEKMGIIAAVDFAYFVKKSVRERMADKGNKQMSLI